MSLDQFRTNLIATVITRERLRPLSRLQRLWRDPWRTLPFYTLAAISHIRPYKIRFATLWGTQMACYLPEGNTFYYYGYCEANLTNFFLRLLKPGDCFLDIGAHVGFYSMLTSVLTGPGGVVVSFEPTPWTYQLLQENVKGLSNVSASNQALADQPGTLIFSDYGPGYGAYNSAHANWGAEMLRGKKQHEITVSTTTLDDYCQEKNLAPHIIKIDTEGFEYQVILGGKKLFGQPGSKPRPIITIEMAGGTKWAANQLRTMELLQEWGYLPYDISLDGHLTTAKIQTSYVYNNIVFIPSERLSSFQNLFSS